MASRVLGRIRSRRVGDQGEKIHSISVRLTGEEKDMLDALCAKYKWNLSQMIQTLIRYAYDHRVPLNPETEVNEISRSRRRQ
jgi:hypothetical protein